MLRTTVSTVYASLNAHRTSKLVPSLEDGARNNVNAQMYIICNPHEKQTQMKTTTAIIANF